MSASLIERLNVTPAQVAALDDGVQRRVVQFLLRWEAFDDALACLERRPPFVSAARESTALALHGLGRSAEALRLLDAALTAQPDPLLRLTYAEIALEAGELSRGQAQIASALEMLRHLSRAWYVAVRLHLAAGDTSAARHALRQLRELAPTSHYVSLSAMAIAAAQGEKVTAAAYATQVLETNAQREPPSVRDLVELRRFFAEIEDRIHLRAVEQKLLERFERERDALLADISPAAVAPAAAPQKVVAPPIARPATKPASLSTITVTASERRKLLNAAHEFFGFDELMPGQAEVLACVLRGDHALAVLPTGAGKSLCYQLPAFMDPAGVTLVVSPLIALMKDQVDNLPPALRSQALAINSMMDGDDLHSALHRIATGQVRLLYAAPERLRQVSFVEMLARAGVARMVIDEAHCVSVWGHDFRPDYLHLRRAHRDLGGPPLLAMTATAPPVVREDIERQLLGETGVMRMLVGDIFRPNLHLRAFRTRDDDERSALLLRLLRSLHGSGIVYARSRQRCEELAATLRQAGFAAAHYHAGIENRVEIQDRFMRNDLQVIVATVAFGMGIDKRDIRFILHDGLPSSVENYYQEIGRAGRDGQPAHCFLIYADHDEAARVRMANRSALTDARVRAVYKAVRESLGTRVRGPAPLDRLARAAGDGTGARVALSVLEEAGLLHRTYDIPRAATIQRPRQPRGQDDAQFAAFLHHSGLTSEQRIRVEFVELAERSGLTPVELEQWLLSWQEARYLFVHYEGRDPFVELAAPPERAGERIEQLIRHRAALDQQRVADIARFARTSTCRHGFLGDYLGSAPRTRCGMCDNCGAAFQLTADPSAAETDAQLGLILQALAEQNWGRRNLVRLLRGDPAASDRARQSAFYGSLRTRSERGLEQLLDSIASDGLVQTRELENGAVVLELTRRGAKTMQEMRRPARRK